MHTLESSDPPQEARKGLRMTSLWTMGVLVRDPDFSADAQAEQSVGSPSWRTEF